MGHKGIVRIGVMIFETSTSCELHAPSVQNGQCYFRNTWVFRISLLVGKATQGYVGYQLHIIYFLFVKDNFAI